MHGTWLSMECRGAAAIDAVAAVSVAAAVVVKKKKDAVGCARATHKFARPSPHSCPFFFFLKKRRGKHSWAKFIFFDAIERNGFVGGTDQQ